MVGETFCNNERLWLWDVVEESKASANGAVRDVRVHALGQWPTWQTKA
jgi:hypothetical protein